MSTLIGTQEFIHEHRDHILHVSEVAIWDDYGPATAYFTPDGAWRVVMDEKEGREYVQTTGVYLRCLTCGVEQEINIGEYDEEN